MLDSIESKQQVPQRRDSRRGIVTVAGNHSRQHTTAPSISPNSEKSHERLSELEAQQGHPPEAANPT